MGVLPDVGLSTVGGPPLTLAAAPVFLKLIYQELTSRPDHRETTTKQEIMSSCMNDEGRDLSSRSKSRRVLWQF